jgi:hypothetical protein
MEHTKFASLEFDVKAGRIVFLELNSIYLRRNSGIGTKMVNNPSHIVQFSL